MSTSIRPVDRGAWLSVNGNRKLGISDLWPLARSDLCECQVTDFLAEGFAEIGVDPPNIEARFAGRCITCGTKGRLAGSSLVESSIQLMETFYASIRNASIF